jgi:sucrose phosphorylase
VLPFFHPIDGADAGFDPIDHTQVDARLGTWEDVAALAARTDVMADVIVNHVSRHSPQFLDYDARGDASPYAGLFLTYRRVFPHGAQESELAALHTPRPSLPFTTHESPTGEQMLLWTTFTSDQIDIDVQHPEGRRYLANVLTRLHQSGIRAIRLDAVGYAIKKAGTSCFMIPETCAFIADFTAQAHALGMDVLVEVHGRYQDQIDVARQVDWVYDFALPPLVLHTLYTRDVSRLMHWLEIRPRNAVTVLDTHDGIGVRDVDGDRGRNASATSQRLHIDSLIDRSTSAVAETVAWPAAARRATWTRRKINCHVLRWRSGRRRRGVPHRRAIQCFERETPQFLLRRPVRRAHNDTDCSAAPVSDETSIAHYYTASELEQQLKRPVVQSLLARCAACATDMRRFRVRSTQPHRPPTGWPWPGGTAQNSLGWRSTCPTCAR